MAGAKIGLIYEKVPRLMEAIGAIPKTGVNRAQHYRFRAVEDVLNRLYPILVEHRCFLAPSIRAHEVAVLTEKRPTGGDRAVFHSRLTLELAIYAEDGSHVCVAAAGEGIDYGGDKASNKAMSAAFKYALGFALCIPYMEVEESDAESRTTTQLQAEPRGGTSESEAQPCGEDRVGRIRELASQLGLTAQDVREKILARYEVQRAAELTVAQAEEVISRLRAKLSERQAQQTF